MSDDSVRQFKQGNAETFKQLLEEKFDHIVTKISPQTWTCVYKFFIENTETENFLKCIEMLSEQGLKEFEKDATVERMKVCIPHNTTLTWIDQELEKARANDDDQKKWIQAKPLLKSTVNKGLAILFSKNTNDVPDVIDILQAMPLEQFMDVLQSCNENILETSLFLTDEELKEDARKETSFGSGKITEERDGVYEVQLKFGICFMPDPARKDDWGGSKLEPTPPPPDVDTQEVIQADVDAQGGAQLPATPVMFEDVVPTAAGTPAFDAETPAIANMTFLPQTPDEPEVAQVVQDDEPQAVAETPSETAQAQQDIDSPVLAASPPANATLPASLENGDPDINDKSVVLLVEIGPNYGSGPKHISVPAEIKDGVYNIGMTDRVNTDFAGYGDSFQVCVKGKFLTCTRTDGGPGWDMNLKVRLPRQESVSFQILYMN
jgi:hypothetical protein